MRAGAIAALTNASVCSRLRYLPAGRFSLTMRRDRSALARLLGTAGGLRLSADRQFQRAYRSRSPYRTIRLLESRLDAGLEIGLQPSVAGIRPRVHHRQIRLDVEDRRLVQQVYSPDP